MVGYLNMTGREEIAVWLHHFFGVQLFITTAVMVYVGYNFFSSFMNSYMPPAKPAASDYSAAKLD